LTAPNSNKVNQRLDKWLWHARFFKTRSLAQKKITTGQVRVGGIKTTTPSHTVKIGDVLTITTPRGVKVVEIKATASRRGPYSEAVTLFHDKSEPMETSISNDKTVARNSNPAPVARPDKRARRDLQRLKYKRHGNI